MKVPGFPLIEHCGYGNFSFAEHFTGQHTSYSIFDTFYHLEIDMPSPPYVFSQLLDLLPRYEFQRIVNKYRGDHRTKQYWPTPINVGIIASMRNLPNR